MFHQKRRHTICFAKLQGVPVSKASTITLKKWRLKKASRPSDRKKTATKAGKKVKKTPQREKAPKSPEFFDSSGEEKRRTVAQG